MIALLSIEDYNTSEFRRLIQPTKDQFLNNVLRGYSSQSRSAFKDYLDNELNISTEYLKIKMQRRNRSSKLIDLIKETHEKYKASDDASREFFDCRAIFSDGMFQPLDWFEGDRLIERVQGPYPEDFESDFRRDMDTITIGQFSCMNHQNGQSMLAHEIGHAFHISFSQDRLSDQSSEKFSEILTCANNLDRSVATINKELRTREVLADLFSYLTFPESTIIHACSYLHPNLSKTSYINITPEERDPERQHSNALLRILREVIHTRKSLPPVCQEFINKNKNNYEFEPCF